MQEKYSTSWEQKNYNTYEKGVKRDTTVSETTGLQVSKPEPDAVNETQG